MQAKNLLLLSWILLITLFSGCSTSQNQLTLHVQNPTSIDRENEMVEVAWKDIRQHLSLPENQTIIVTDSLGEQVPYQLITNGTDTVEVIVVSCLIGCRSDCFIPGICRSSGTGEADGIWQAGT